MQQQQGQFIYVNGGQTQQQYVGQNVVAMAPGQQPEQQFVVLAPAPIQKQDQTNKFNLYKKLPSRLMGGTQIFLGVLMISLNIWAALADNYWRSGAWVIGTGWWASPFVITAGSFGIAAGYRPNNCTVTTTMVLSIFSSVCMIAVFVQCGLSLSNWYSGPSGTAANSLFIIAGLAEVVIAVIQSVFCGKVLCSSKPVTQQYITNQGQTYANGGYVASYVNPQGGVNGQGIPMQNMQNIQNMQQVSMPTNNVAMPTSNVAVPTNVAMQNNMAMPSNVAMPANAAMPTNMDKPAPLTHDEQPPAYSTYARQESMSL